MGSVVGLTIWSRDFGNATLGAEETSSSLGFHPDKMVAFFSMVHVGIWILIGLFDRYVRIICMWVHNPKVKLLILSWFVGTFSL